MMLSACLPFGGNIPNATCGNQCMLNSRVFDYNKIFCIDVDGINQGEAPFGYGLRYDGKIITGERADAWLNKDIESKD